MDALQGYIGLRQGVEFLKPENWMSFCPDTAWDCFGSNLQGLDVGLPIWNVWEEDKDQPLGLCQC